MRFLRWTAAMIFGVGLLAAAVPGHAQEDRDRDGRAGQTNRWEQPPSEYTRDIQRQAYRDGMRGGREDAINHRNPDVNNRDEFRHYHGPDRGAYKEAFVRGYNTYYMHTGDRRGGDRRRDDEQGDDGRRDDQRRDNQRRDDQPHN